MDCQHADSVMTMMGCSTPSCRQTCCCEICLSIRIWRLSRGAIQHGQEGDMEQRQKRVAADVGCDCQYICCSVCSQRCLLREGWGEGGWTGTEGERKALPASPALRLCLEKLGRRRAAQRAKGIKCRPNQPGKKPCSVRSRANRLCRLHACTARPLMCPAATLPA